MSRWDILPISEQEQKYLAGTTTSTVATMAAPIRRNLGGLLRQEISDSGQTICYYRMTGGDMPVPYMCDMGCCSHGCCTVADLAIKSNSWGWGIGLLCLVIAVIIVGVVAMLAVIWLNRQQDKKHKEHIKESSLESGSVSQISGPTDFYLNDHYYLPYGSKHY